MILRGANGKHGECGVHKNPQNVLVYNNRIYITIEWGSWGRRYHAPTVISCDCDKDLLDYENLVIPHPVKYDPSWEQVSKDLKKWDLVCDLIDERDKDPLYTGFRYVDFDFEGNDIIWLCRTAQNQGHNYHDSNYITFHRTKNFRDIKY